MSDLAGKVTEMLEEFPAARTLGPKLAPFTRPQDQESLSNALERAFA
jgi:hypothetical protein